MPANRDITRTALNLLFLLHSDECENVQEVATDEFAFENVSLFPHTRERSRLFLLGRIPAARESLTVSLTGKRLESLRKRAAETLDSAHYLAVAQIIGHESIQLAVFSLDDLDLLVEQGSGAIKRKTDGGVSFNFGRFRELSSVALFHADMRIAE